MATLPGTHMTDTATLKNGEEMCIRTMEPPLGAYADKVGCWREIREDLLGGAFAEWLYTPYFVGEIDGRVVGSLSYYVATDRRDVGVIEFVATDVNHRSKGIASFLMKTAIGRFRQDDGKALYLCTTNPIAGHLYERHGFDYYVGDGMRYLAPGAEDFDQTRWVYTGTARVRDATWGDLPELSALYNHPEPGWLLKDSLTQTFAGMRYESHFVKLMRRIEGGQGGYLVLENPSGQIVGAASFERAGTFYEQHVATLGFRVIPAYQTETHELLERVAEKAKAVSIRTLQIPITACDDDQAHWVEAVGFSEEARLKDRLRADEGWLDVLLYARTMEEDTLPYRPIDDYYGTRKTWQKERLGGG